MRIILKLGINYNRTIDYTSTNIYNNIHNYHNNNSRERSINVSNVYSVNSVRFVKDSTTILYKSMP